jgi:hypothetical protein
MIFILSYHTNFLRRKKQRESWLQALPENYEYKFLVGNPHFMDWANETQRFQFENEVKAYDDIIVSMEVTESYRRVSYKVFWGFEWVLQHRPHVDYIVKTDDDIYLKLPMLLELFDNRAKPDPFAYWGYVYSDKVPVRNPTSQWYITEEEYPSKDVFPPYACGAFYFLTPDLAKLVVNEFRSTKFRIFPFEDIHMGMVVHSVGYAPEHNKELFYCDRDLSKDKEKEMFVHDYLEG